MQLVYNVDVDDLVALSDHHVRSSPAVQRQVQVLRFACAALTLVACGGAGYLIGDRWYIFVAGGVLGSIVGVLYFPRWFYRANQRQARKLYTEGRNASVLGRHTLTLEDDGLREASEASETLHGWPTVERVERTDTHVFIYVSALAAIVVGERQVQEGDLDALVAAVQERI